MKRVKGNKGITLIALVITIIVLLILAGVSIATLGGDNGIISRAKNASTVTKEKQAEEEGIIIANEYEMYKKRCEAEGKKANIKDFLDSHYKDRYEEHDGKFKILTDTGNDVEVDNSGNITVNDNIVKSQNVSNITITGETEVGVGASITLTAKIDDEGAKYTSIEWSSSDTTKAEVTGNELMCTVLGMEKGNATIICKFINYDGTIVSKNFEISIVDNPILAEVVNVGDYINYNAGNWTETKGAPASEGGFGGYSSGTSKNVGLSSGSGWRVYTKSSNVVTIVHVGCPALYYLGTAGDAGANNLNNFCNNNFVNNNFATSARSANVNDVATYGNTISSTSVMMCGRNYWLATSSYMYHQGDSLLCVTSGGLTYVTQKEALRCSPYSYIKSRIKNNRNFN